jgi:hypothetical protein
MRTTIRWIFSLTSFVLVCTVSPALRAGGEEVFKGIIADSQCAMNVHSLSQSHKEMLEGKSVGTTESDCVWYCITQRGGRFVLQNKGRVYKLDKQDFTRDYAGQKVRVTGTLDEKTNIIHVRAVEILAEPAKPTSPHN